MSWGASAVGSKQFTPFPKESLRDGVSSWSASDIPMGTNREGGRQAQNHRKAATDLQYRQSLSGLPQAKPGTRQYQLLKFDDTQQGLVH